MTAGDSDDTLVCCVENTVEVNIMDSGASFHATYCKEELERFKLRSGKTLKDVRYIRGLKRRLILVGQLDEEGYHIGFGDQQWKLLIAPEETSGLGKQKRVSSIISENTRKLQRLQQQLRAAYSRGGMVKEEYIAPHLKVFGCDSFVKVKDVCGEAMKCTFIGNDSDEMRYSFRDQRVTWLSEAEILYLWTLSMEPCLRQIQVA
ncbi:hypothetical protein Tco_1430613 [Tanacetum coccineum]